MVAGLLALGLVIACNQPPPPGSEVGAESNDDADDPETGSESPSASDMAGDTDDGPVDTSIYPLVDGARWTYRVTSTNGQVLGEDIVEVSEMTWEGQQAWLLVGNDEADDSKWNESVIIRDGDLALRVHKVEVRSTGDALIEYEPGFVRANQQWWGMLGYKEELLYVRTETDELGVVKVRDRGHTYEVLALEPVKLPVGTFDSVKVERIRTVGNAAGEIVISWYVPGIGKVREYRPAASQIEELTSVAIPGGVNLP